MGQTPDESNGKQVDLQGKPTKKGKIKYRRLFSKHSRKKRQITVGQYRAESEPEAKIIEWLTEHGIAFESHGAIPQASTRVDANRLLEDILLSYTSEDRELLTTTLKLKKIDNNRSIGRYDFKVDGTNRSTGRFETYYIEYWGMYNPSVKVTKESMRRLYNRLLANYTLIKKPLKESYYRLLGFNLISLTRADLKKKVMDEKLGCLLCLDQKHLITRYIPEKQEEEESTDGN